MRIEIRRYEKKNQDSVITLIAEFRVKLRSLKDKKTEPDLAEAREELEFYLDSKYPIFVGVDKYGYIVAYMVLKKEKGLIWLESLFVDPKYRRHGIASQLLAEAEDYIASYPQECLYTWIHPNNVEIIKFLHHHGYNVLNLIEIRKPYKEEALNSKVKVQVNELQTEFQY